MTSARLHKAVAFVPAVVGLSVIAAVTSTVLGALTTVEPTRTPGRSLAGAPDVIISTPLTVTPPSHRTGSPARPGAVTAISHNLAHTVPVAVPAGAPGAGGSGSTSGSTGGTKVPHVVGSGSGSTGVGTPIVCDLGACNGADGQDGKVHRHASARPHPAHGSGAHRHHRHGKPRASERTSPHGDRHEGNTHGHGPGHGFERGAD